MMFLIEICLLALHLEVSGNHVEFSIATSLWLLGGICKLFLILVTF